MKKTVSLFICAMLTLSLVAAFAVGASAANNPPDKGAIFDIYYGKANVDGVKDDSYFADPSVRSYVHNCTYENKDYAYPAGKETGFECWLMWDESTLYGFVEVTDYSPVTYAFKDYKTDCLELNFILTDWARFADKGSNVYSDIGDPGLARFRISNPVGATVSALYELLPQNGGLSVEDELSGLSKCAVVKSDKGYNVEFSIKVPDSIVHLVCTPGAHIGFGIQCNDDVNDNQNRDAIIYSTNLDDTHGKTGEFVMLDKDGSRPDAPVSREPAATTAEATTKAPEKTTAAPEKTTAAPEKTTAAPVGTTAASGTTAATASGSADSTAASGSKSGCGSYIGAGAALAVISAIVGSAIVCGKRK